MTKVEYITEDYENLINFSSNDEITYFVKNINSFNLKIDITSEAAVNINIVMKLNNACQFKLDINHGKDTKSNVLLKVITEAGGKIMADINSIAGNRATGVVMDQQTKILALGDISSKINPNLLIANSDVDASHGVSIGNINTDSMYYLMTKGFDKAKAKELLIQSFLLGEQPSSELKSFFE